MSRSRVLAIMAIIMSLCIIGVTGVASGENQTKVVMVTWKVIQRLTEMVALIRMAMVILTTLKIGQS